jgi:methyl-accepting chemotaxis protein
MLKNMTIKMRLVSGFGVVILVALSIATASLVVLRSTARDLDKIVRDRWPKTVWANDIANNINVVARAMRNVLLVKDRAVIKEELDRIEKADKTIDERIENLNKTVVSEKGKELLGAIKDSKAAYLENRNIVVKAIQNGKKDEAAELLLKRLRPKQAVYFKTVEDLIVYQGSLMEESGKDAAKNVKNVTVLVLILLAIAISLGLITSLWIIRSITKPLNEAVTAANKIAEGDLAIDIEVRSRDETGQLLDAMKQMVEKLKGIVTEIRSTSENVASGSGELSAISEQINRGLTDQSGRSQQIATASEQMSQTVTDVAKNASNIASSTTQAAEVAKNGESIVIKSVEEVKAIATTVEHSARLMKSLGNRSAQIGNIVDVIKDIADQTNLLALNAAIEAARAGDQGRGFAVVADEVRKLAERTGKATSEISGMIKAIQGEVDNAVQSMDLATNQVEAGVERSAQAGEALQYIVRSVGDLQSMVQQIASGTDEMSSVSEQVSGDMQAIATSSAEMSSVSGQIARSSSDLAMLAANLHAVVIQFQVTNNGNGRHN